MKFTKEDLQAMAYGDHVETYEVVYDEISYTSRWSIHYDMIFKHNEKFYRTHYRRGATECQDESPYDYDDPEIECVEVFPTQVTMIQYLSRQELNARN